MSNIQKKLSVLLLMSLLLSSCATDSNVPQKSDPAETGSRVTVSGEGTAAVSSGDSAVAEAVPEMDLSEFDTMTDAEDAVTIVLNGTSAECGREDVTVEEGRITITDAGSYLLTGDFTGQIVVRAGADDNVHLILSGVSITNDMAPIYIENCKNASITLASGTVNSVSDSQNYTFADGEDEPDAAVYSDCDLTINGDGTLNVTGNYACGIRTKDDLKIVSGTINVTSVGDAVKGRDSLRISGGTFHIISESDGLKSNNDEDADRGYVLIEGGDFTISAGDDAVHAESRLVVNGGNLTVLSSYEGLEAMKVELNGGVIDVTASDDALNAASPSTGDNEADDWFGQWQDQRKNGGNRGGSMTETDTIPSQTTPSDENSRIPDEEIERWSQQMPGGMGGFGNMMPPDGMTIPDGMTPPDGMEFPASMTPADPEQPDGAQPEFPEMPGGGTGSERGDRGERGNKGGDMVGGFGGNMGGMMGRETPEEGVWIRITGGTIRLCGGVDVLDSNGTIEITGGTLITDTQRLSVYGSPDGVFDANGDVTISGGTYAAYAQSTGSAAQITQNPSLTVSESVTAGTKIEVTSTDGQVMFTDTANQGGRVFFLTSDGLAAGEEYTVTIGDISRTVTAQ